MSCVVLNKRLIGCVIVKNNWAVQSVGYGCYLPLGRPEFLVENLDHWGVDEILVLSIDRSRYDLGPDLDLLRHLSELGISTPLIYGGGVQTKEHAISVIRSGADRLCIDAALSSGFENIRDIASSVGSQALIAATPLSQENGNLLHYDYISHEFTPIEEYASLLSETNIFSEVMVVDWANEGKSGSFNMELVSRFPFDDVSIIPFGGISQASQMSTLLEVPNIGAVAIGNFLNYSEHSLQKFKEQIINIPIRNSEYAKSYE